jgi:ligand-binding sensor domain-containing protein
MKRLLYILLVLFFYFNTNTLSQNPQWIIYDSTNSVLQGDMIYCLALDNTGNKWMGVHDYTGLGFNTAGICLVKFDGTDWIIYDTLNSEIPTNTVRCISIDQSNNKWIGTGWAWTGWEFIRERGVVKFDGSQWTVYDNTTSGLSGNDISCIAIDDFGNKWIGTGTTSSYPISSGKGLARFDGMNWTVYDTSNSEIPSNSISSIVIDDYDNKWIGTYDAGITKFDGSQWTIYDTTNSGLPSNAISCVTIDQLGNIWIGIGPARPAWWSGEGLVKFDGTDWTVYDTLNSDIPSNHISCIIIDDYNNKWIGTNIDHVTHEGGLAKFDDTNWTVYNESNSGLPHDMIGCIVIDQYDNKWIGTGTGLAVFNENGIVSVNENIDVQGTIPNNFLLYQNYPNPFNPSTKIRYSVPQSSNVIIKVFDILGNEIETLVKEEKPTGTYEITWYANQLPSGVYFYQLKAGDPSSSSGQGFVETKKMIFLK